ncbi:MAG: ABC transporter substrate-binding protein [Acidimicrobiia bacterium]|nr:ABC transporter substrate-binding protein [Acidimicrobiia bacterium]
MTTWRRSGRWFAVLAATVVLAAACGGDDTEGAGDTTATECDSLDEVRLQLQWVAQSQFAGYFAALDEGMYEDECLDVTILEGAVDIVPQQVLATGGAEFALAWVPKALVSCQAGADIVNIAQVFERSGTLMVSFADSGITSVEDFAGRNVGNWGFGNEFELTAAIAEAGLTDSVTLVAQDFTMNALLNGEIDVAEAMTYNEYAQVLEAVNPDTGELYQPEELNVVDFNDVGTAMLQDAVWAEAAWLADNEDIAERFLRASFRGWVFCRDNFDACVEHVLNNGSTLGESHQRWQLNEINALIWPATNGIGVMNVPLWDQTVDVATSQIPDLAGVDIGPDAYRTDLAEAATAALEEEGLDVTGEGWERIDVELVEGGA